jgi:hypothetical protein
MLDPKTLTPESLYRLQSETWTQGAEAELERIILLLRPYAQHDEEMCYWENGKQICYPEDCSAPIYEHVLQVIQEHWKQENLHERTNNPSNGDGLIPEMAKSAPSHEIRGCFLEVPNPWLKLVHDIDRMMSLADPDYQLFQVKDKFGQLRYYWGTEKAHARDLLGRIASMGERAATTICAMCGEWASAKSGYWNVCEAHKNND